MIKAIIFDQDGVIIDSEPLHYESVRILLKKHNIPFSKEEHKKFQGRNLRDLLEEVLKDRKINQTIEELINENRKIWEELAKQDLKIFPGFYRLIKLIKKKYKIALTTSVRRKTREIVEEIFPEQKGIFEVEVTGEEVKNTKPHPEPYLSTATRLKLKPEECIVIEDTINGIKSAKAAGMKVIAITNTFGKKVLEKENPDIIINSLKEINLKFIKNLEK